VAFVDCAAFGRQAETIGQYCTKGKPLFVEGRLKYDSWDDKSGHGKRSKLTVTVENFQFIGAKGDTEFPADMFTASNASASGSASGSGSGSGTDARRSDRGNAEAPGKSADHWNGDLPPDGTRKRKRGTAQQPFGEEKQFEEADIPF
jgi:single-strand DNA-binding protein